MTPTALSTTLRALRSRNEKGLIPFISAGDPDLATTRDVLLALTDAGAAAIEIGVPFSDPIADGPTIQAASQRAIEAGTSLGGILDLLESLKGQIAPTVIFSYLNPIHRMGYDVFATRARQADVSALLMTDATTGVEPEVEQALEQHQLDLIRLVAPTTPVERLPAIVRGASGFLYVIARRGVTGRGSEQGEATSHLAHLRELTDIPLYVGFGVREREDVVRLQEHADGVIVGSALVELMHEAPKGQQASVAGAYLRRLAGR